MREEGNQETQQKQVGLPAQCTGERQYKEKGVGKDFMALVWLPADDVASELAGLWLLEQAPTQKVREEALLNQHEILTSKFQFLIHILADQKG